MDLLNKLSKKASETYQVTKEKAVNFSEEFKLRGKISDIKNKIEKLYNEIGEKVYNEIKDGKDVSKEDITVKCEEISKLKDEISKLEEDILAIKKVKKCPNCNTELDIGAEFCSKCGKKQPKIEKVEIKEEPEEVKEAEVLEVNNVEPKEEIIEIKETDENNTKIEE